VRPKECPCDVHLLFSSLELSLTETLLGFGLGEMGVGLGWALSLNQGWGLSLGWVRNGVELGSDLAYDWG